MKRLILFFVRGPGAILLVVCAIILVGWAIKQGQDKQRAEAEKRQKTRELGAVNPRENVDASQAAKEALLSDRKLSAGFNTAPEAAPIPNAPVLPRGQQQQLPSLVSFYAQVAATPQPTPAPAPERRDPETWLPPSIMVPCSLVITIESSHINTPVLGIVIRDMYENGHLIVPAGTLVSSFAQSGAVRDRIEVSGTWVFVFPDGRSLKVKGIALDREADPSYQNFGVEDGSAGLQGELVESDHWANAKAFIGILMTAAMQTGTAAVNGAVSNSSIGGGVVLPDTTPVLGKYLDQLLNGETGDGRFVRVPASKEFYVFVMETLRPDRRSIDNSASIKTEEPSSLDSLSGQGGVPIELERRFLQQNQQSQQNDNSPKFTY
jgi:Bacterial conjugation TrbI-like protein